MMLIVIYVFTVFIMDLKVLKVLNKRLEHTWIDVTQGEGLVLYLHLFVLLVGFCFVLSVIVFCVASLKKKNSTIV